MSSKNIESLKKLYFETAKDHMQPVIDFYHPNIEFVDPIGSHQGRDELLKYYDNLYKNVKSIKFEFSNFVESGDSVVAIWKMTLETEKLNSGEAFTVEGNSIIKFDTEGKAIYHRDYFDMGEFIYERVPVVGFLVRKIKAKLKE